MGHATQGDPHTLDFDKLSGEESTLRHLANVREFILRDSKTNLVFRERILYLAKEANEQGVFDE